MFDLGQLLSPFVSISGQAGKKPWVLLWLKWGIATTKVLAHIPTPPPTYNKNSARLLLFFSEAILTCLIGLPAPYRDLIF